MPRGSKSDLPGTIQRSPAKARRTFEETLDSAHAKGRSSMNKQQVAEPIARKQD